MSPYPLHIDKKPQQGHGSQEGSTHGRFVRNQVPLRRNYRLAFQKTSGQCGGIIRHVVGLERRPNRPFPQFSRGTQASGIRLSIKPKRTTVKRIESISHQGWIKPHLTCQVQGFVRSVKQHMDSSYGQNGMQSSKQASQPPSQPTNQPTNETNQANKQANKHTQPIRLKKER